MKKLNLLIVTLVAFSSLAVYAEDINIQPAVVKVPRWEDFCEAGYVNAQRTDKDDYFNVLTFVQAERIKRNYWYDRRISFEKYLNNCNNIPDLSEQSVCYTKLRNVETDKNDDYNRQRKQMLYQNNIRIEK